MLDSESDHIRSMRPFPIKARGRGIAFTAVVPSLEGTARSWKTRRSTDPISGFASGRIVVVAEEVDEVEHVDTERLDIGVLFGCSAMPFARLTFAAELSV